MNMSNGAGQVARPVRLCRVLSAKIPPALQRIIGRETSYLPTSQEGLATHVLRPSLLDHAGPGHAIRPVGVVADAVGVSGGDAVSGGGGADRGRDGAGSPQ